jgi:CubicO group peptidase (beta-lactamase class C family)
MSNPAAAVVTGFEPGGRLVDEPSVITTEPERNQGERTMRFSRGLTLAVALAMAVLATVPGHAMPPPAYQTTLNVYEANKLTGALGGALETETWPLNRAGVSFARPFQVGDQFFLFLLRQHSGEASIFHLGADGKIGAVVETRKLEQGWTSAEFIRGAGTVLVLHNAFTGQVRSFRVQADGKLNAAAESDFTLTRLQDQFLFSPYLFKGKWRLFSLDPWTGKALASSDSWVQVTEAQWTRGWTSLDHLVFAGSTYRLLYKAAGDPHETGAADTKELGRLVIQKVGADSPQNLFDIQVEAGWSSVRFVPSTGEPVSATRILFYRNNTGEYALRTFTPLTGIGKAGAQGKIEVGATDLRVFLAGTRIFLTALNEENAVPFTASQAETMALTIHNGLKNKAVGYQFLLLQSGKVVYSRAWGLTRVTPSPVAMTSRTRLDLGSVGKMMTTLTTLKLVDQGKVFLNHPIAGQLDPDKYPPATLNGWVKDRNLIDLMKQTSGLEGKGEDASPGCTGDKATFQVTCKKFFAAEPTLACVNGLCPRSYNNANFGALRQVIENVSGTTTAAELVKYTHDLWARGLGLAGTNALSCSAPAESFSFTHCASAEGCVLSGGNWWRQEELDRPYSTSCGAGGWYASSRQMGEFMAAARYTKVLSDNINDLWMSTEHTALKDGKSEAGATALGWEPAWTAETGGEKLLHKDGARIGNTYVTQLPSRMDAVLIVNTGVGSQVESFLRHAYLYAAGLSSEPPVYVEAFQDGSADADEVSQVAATGRVLTASRLADGTLHLIHRTIVD